MLKVTVRMGRGEGKIFYFIFDLLFDLFFISLQGLAIASRKVYKWWSKVISSVKIPSLSPMKQCQPPVHSGLLATQFKLYINVTNWFSSPIGVWYDSHYSYQTKILCALYLSFTIIIFICEGSFLLSRARQRGDGRWVLSCEPSQGDEDLSVASVSVDHW